MWSLLTLLACAPEPSVPAVTAVVTGRLDRGADGAWVGHETVDVDGGCAVARDVIATEADAACVDCVVVFDPVEVDLASMSNCENVADLPRIAPSAGFVLDGDDGSGAIVVATSSGWWPYANGVLDGDTLTWSLARAVGDDGFDPDDLREIPDPDPAR